MKAVRDVLGEYTFSKGAPVSEDAVLEAAADILFRRLQRQGELPNPIAAAEYLRHLLGGLRSEVFVVMWLDTRHRIIGTETLFRGTVDSCSIYIRETVAAALRCNAAACILSHNHPSSGSAEPSRADQEMTVEIKRALALVSVRVIDHIVVGPMETVSFAQSGLL